MEPQEVIPLPVGRDLRFLRTQSESEFPFQHLPDQCQRLLRLRVVLAEHDEVISVPHKAVSGGMQPPVQTIQHDVRQQGRNHPSLRRADGRGLEDPVFHHARSEKSLQQSENVPVGHLRGYRSHDDGVRQVVEKSLDVGVEHRAVPFAMTRQDLLDRLMAVATGDEPVGMFVKARLEGRGKKPTYHLLRYPIPNPRNAERPLLRRAGAFGNVDASQRRGTEASVLQFPHQRCQVLLQVRCEHLDADLVHARRPAIPLDRQEGLLHHPAGNPPGERVYLDFAHGEPFTLCNQGVRTGELWGVFLSVPAVAGFPGFPGKSAGGPVWGFSQGG